MRIIGRLTTGVVIGAAAMAFSVAQADTEVGGFAEPALHWDKTSTAAEGFHIADGAVVVSHKEGAASVMADFGFTSNGFSTDQVYFKHDLDGMSWTLGTKDTPFGFEANDGNAIAFTGHGALYGAMPKSHTGVSFDMAFGPANVTLLVAETGSAVNRVAGASPDAGVNLSFGMGDMMNMSVGYLYVPGDTATGLLDVVLNYKGSGFNAGLGFDMFQEGYGGLAESAWGLVAQALFDVNESTHAGFRFDMLSKVAAFSMWDLTVGPQFKVTDALKLKVDYTMTSVTLTDGGTATTSHAAAVAGVYNF